MDYNEVLEVLVSEFSGNEVEVLLQRSRTARGEALKEVRADLARNGAPRSLGDYLTAQACSANICAEAVSSWLESGYWRAPDGTEWGTKPAQGDPTPDE